MKITSFLYGFRHLSLPDLAKCKIGNILSEMLIAHVFFSLLWRFHKSAKWPPLPSPPPPALVSSLIFKALWRFLFSSFHSLFFFLFLLPFQRALLSIYMVTFSFFFIIPVSPGASVQSETRGVYLVVIYTHSNSEMDLS